MIKRSIKTGVFGTRKIMWRSLSFSLLIHGIIFFAFQNAFPVYFDLKPLRTFQVELIRPPVEDMKTDPLSGTALPRLKELSKPKPKNDQDTISLDTTDERYISYAKLIKERIMTEWRYPEEAKNYLVEGSLSVLFSLIREGQLTQIEITRPSGYDILDQEAIRAIRWSSPFPAFPGNITVSRLNIKANFDYRLASKKTIKREIKE